MGWERLAHVELSSAGDTLDSGTFAAKEKLRVIIFCKNDGQVSEKLQFNNDTGSNYARRRRRGSESSDATSTSIDGIDFTESSTADSFYNVIEISNISNEEKFGMCEHMENFDGAGNAPNRGEWVFKWTNTSSQITSIQYKNVVSGDIGVGSYITVLGAKEPATADTITVDSLAAKEHLKIQYKGIRSGDMIARLRFNNDSGNNYAQRLSDNGGSDGTNTSQSGLEIATSASNNEFSTIYVVNEAAKEKLVVAEIIGANTAGAGNAPRRRELSGKWANTSNAITRVDFVNTSTGDFAEGSEVIVWGSDGAADITYPTLVGGYIFEETDTGKHYIFDGSSTWTEVA